MTHLASNCEVMALLVERHEIEQLVARPPEEYFQTLVDSIIGQQLSVKAAAKITERFRDGVGSYDAALIADHEVEHLRTFGLSNSKARYIVGIAEAFRDGVIDPHALSQASEAELMAELTALKGVGPWTAEMFLMFGMGRPDVWSNGDLGLNNAIASLFGPAAVRETVIEPWRPYRTYAALYLWEHSDNPPLS